MFSTFAVYIIIFMHCMYVCLNNIHVAVCPLIVIHPFLHEFPVVSLMSSVMAVWSLV